MATLHLIVVFAVAALALQGCAQIIPGLNVRVGSKSTPQYDLVQIDPDVLTRLAQEKIVEDAVPLSDTLPSDIPPEYQIGAGDIIYVTVWDHPELTTPNGPVTELATIAGQTQAQYVQGRLVNADGTIFYPYVGLFKVAGMTATQARKYIAQNLVSVITKPQVDVRVIAYRAARVEVAGEVARPGTVTLDDTPKGIIQAINLTGGLTVNASRRTAWLVRNGVTYRIDLATLLSGQRAVGNPMLKAGDVVHIPDQSDDQVFVLGAVAKQAPVVIRQASISLVEALTNAGGLEELRGKQSGVIVFRMKRYSTGLKPTVYTLDLLRPDGLLLAGEFALKPRDVVYVQATEFAQFNSIITTLLPSVTTIYELHELHVNQ